MVEDFLRLIFIHLALALALTAAALLLRVASPSTACSLLTRLLTSSFTRRAALADLGALAARTTDDVVLSLSRRRTARALLALLTLTLAAAAHTICAGALTTLTFPVEAAATAGATLPGTALTLRRSLANICR